MHPRTPAVVSSILAALALAASCHGFRDASRPPNVATAPINPPARASGLQARPAQELPIQVRESARASWLEVRRRHLFHMQAVFSGGLPEDHKVFVVTEPPPHASMDDIRRILGAETAWIETWKIGYNGWARDVVAVARTAPNHNGAPGTIKRERDRLEELHRFLFFTSYGAEVYSPSESPPPTEVLDIEVPPLALKNWVLDGHQHFQKIDVAPFSKATPVDQRTPPGVYRADHSGLVIWALPHSADLCEHRVAARQFAVASDLILGAVQHGRNVYIVGRERSLPALTMPPLRTESLLRLADFRANHEKRIIEDARAFFRQRSNDQPMLSTPRVRPLQLAQSFQRMNLFAGRLANGDDWCPILLSPELTDDEFGGILNIADQILKSWTLNGTIRYQEFPYPDPTEWAAPRPLTEQLVDATATESSLQFNWNTAGGFALVRWGDVSALVPGRTGALPITYIQDGDSQSNTQAIERAEVRYHDYFAAQRDPVLARVVAYSAFLNISEAYSFSASCLTPGHTPSRAEHHLEDLAGQLLSGQDTPVARPHQTAYQEQALDELREDYRRVRTQYGEDGAKEFIHYLAGIQGTSSVPAPRDQLRTAAVHTANRHSFGFEPQLLSVFDRDALLKELLALAEDDGGHGWLRTPTVVVSRTETRSAVIGGRHVTVTGMGGHNVDGSALLIKVGDKSLNGKPKIRTGKSSQEYHEYPVAPEFAVRVPRDEMEIGPGDLEYGLSRPLHFYSLLAHKRIDEKTATERLVAAWRRQKRVQSAPPPVSAKRTDIGTAFTVVRIPEGEKISYHVTLPSGKVREFAQSRDVIEELPRLLLDSQEKGGAEIPVRLGGFTSKEQSESFLLNIGAALSRMNAGSITVLVTVDDKSPRNPDDSPGDNGNDVDRIFVHDDGLTSRPGASISEYRLRLDVKKAQFTVRFVTEKDPSWLQRQIQALAKRLHLKRPPEWQRELEIHFRERGLEHYMLKYFIEPGKPLPQWYLVERDKAPSAEAGAVPLPSASIETRQRQ